MKILICDDQAVIRDGLEMLLAPEKDFQVAGFARNGREALELTAHIQPDLILMDLNMPVMNGIEATREINANFPHIKILVLSTSDDDEWVLGTLKAGAAGYLLKDTPRHQIIDAIRGAMDGKNYIDPVISGKLLSQIAAKGTRPTAVLLKKLTGPELDVLHLIARETNHGEIASQLGLSEETVRNHVSAILEKVGVPDGTRAAIIETRHGSW